MRQQDGTRSLVAHVSGEDRWQHFKVADAPADRLRTENFEQCRQDAAAKRRILFAGAQESPTKRY